jgi:hypothetical protein
LIPRFPAYPFGCFPGPPAAAVRRFPEITRHGQPELRFLILGRFPVCGGSAGKPGLGLARRRPWV